MRRYEYQRVRVGLLLLFLVTITASSNGVARAESNATDEFRNNPPNQPWNLTQLEYRVTNHSPLVSWNGGDPDNDPVTYYVAVGTSSDPTNVVWSGTTTYTTNLGNLVDGNFYYWRVRGFDGQVYGAWSANQTFGMNSPPTRPTVSYPNGGECIKGISTVTLRWQESTNNDPTKPDDSIAYTLFMSTDGGVNWNGIAYTTNAGYYDWVSYGITAGQCMFRVTAGDDYETTTDDSNSVFWIDTTKPDSSCYCSQYANVSPVGISYSASDAGCGIQEIRLWYRYESGAWTNSGVTSNQPTGTLLFHPSAGEGIYRFYTITTDLAGNVEITPPAEDASVIYDITDPNSSASAVAYTNATPISVEFVAYDALAGVQSTYLWYKYQTGAWTNTGQSLSGTSGTFIFQPTFGDGTYNFRTISTDRAGNQESKTSSDTTTLLDRVRPQSAITPTPPPYVSATAITLNFSSSDASSGIQETNLWHKFGSGSWSQTAIAPVPGNSGVFGYAFLNGEGVYYFASQTLDRAGNYEDVPSGSGDASVTFDITAPQSTASCGQYTNESPVAVSYTASDNLSGLNGVSLYFKMNQPGIWSPSGLPTQSTPTGVFNYTPLSQGTFYFGSVAEDNAHNHEPNPSGNGDCHIVYDIQPPESNATTTAYNTGATIPVTWTASDEISGVARTYLWYRYELGDWTNSGLSQTGVSGNFPFTPVGEGTYHFASVAIDNANNSESQPTGNGDCSTIYDDQMPNSSATCQPYTQVAAVQINWTASDSASGISHVELWVKNGTGSWGNSGLPSQTGNSGTFVFVLSNQGRFYFATRAYDVAGNDEGVPTGSGDASTFYDSVAPASTVSELPSITYNDIIDLPYTFSDAEPSSQVATVEIYYRKDAGTWLHGPTDSEPDGSVQFDFTAYGGEGFYEFEAVATDYAGNHEHQNGAAEAYTLKEPSRVINVVLNPSTTAIHPGSQVTVEIVLDSSLAQQTAVCTITVYTQYDPHYFSAPQLNDRMPTQSDGSQWTHSAVDAHWDDDGQGMDAVQFEKLGSVGVAVTDQLTAYELVFSVRCDAPFVVDGRTDTVISVITDTASVVACGGEDVRGGLTPLTLHAGTNSAPTAPTLSQTGAAWAGWCNQPPRLEATSTDPQSDQFHGMFSIDNGTAVAGTTAASGAASTYTPSALIEGDHYWSAYSTDVCAASSVVQANSGNVAFRIDLHAPGSLTALSITPNTWTNINNFDITWNNPADLSGIAGVYYKLGTAPSSPTDGTLVLGNEIEALNDLTISQQGAIAIYLWLVDQAGNANQQNAVSGTLYYDINAPLVSITSPADDGCINTQTFMIAGAAQDGTSGVNLVRVSLDNGSTWQDAAGVDNWSLSWQPSGEGTYQLKAEGIDLAGNTGYTQTTQVSVDWTPPTSIITEPANGACLNQNTIVVHGTASDTGCGVQSVQISLDGGATFTSADGTATWQYSWTPTQTGPFNIVTKAVDRGGNVQASPTTISLTIDRSAPNVAVSEPSDGECFNTAELTIHGTASDTGCGVASVELSFDDGTTWQAAEGADTWSYTWAPTADGAYSVSVRALDQAANASTPVTLQLSRDTVAPRIWFAGYWDTDLSTPQGGNLLILAYCPDDDVSEVSLYYNAQPTGIELSDDGLQGDWAAGDKLYTLSFPNLGQGLPSLQIQLSIYAIDQCGNIGKWPECEVK